MNRLFFSITFAVILFAPAVASEPQIWTVNSRAEVLKGDARSVSVDANGTITLAPKLTEVFKTEQPYVWSSAIDASGNVYLGTGGEGRVYKITNGVGAMYSDLNELNVSALAFGKGGELFAATSPDGKVYQIDSTGKATVYFEPKEKYIWSLAVMNDGSLAVGTGETGKLYRVRSAGAAPAASLMFDSSETHIISLAVDKSGNLYAGTDSSGLVIRFGSDGKPFALLDSPLREIHELAIGPDGSLYALAIGESASVAKPPEGPAASPSPESKTVTADAPNPMQPAPPQKSRYDLTGAKTAVYRIMPEGGDSILYSSPTVTGFSLYAHQNGSGVLLGTSDKGRIYSINNDGRESLALQTDAGQISTIVAQGTNLYATSSNQGRLFKIGPETLAEGIYESSVLDAKAAAAWGSMWWRANGNVVLETRSGNTETPNETWSAWQAVPAGSQRGKVASPRSRYLQWRGILKAGAAPSILNEVAVAFLARNIAPEVLAINILPANVGLIANPAPQVDPNIEASGLDPLTFGIPVQSVPPRRVYLRGARAFQWQAEDRNGDKIVYDVYYKEVGDTTYKLLKTNSSENFYSLDGLSLADGRYTIKIVAKDDLGNTNGQALAGERISEPFDIDNSQPTVVVVGQPAVSGNNARVAFAASDRWGYIVRAEYSVNGGEWQTVYADDGISDGPEEKYSFDVPVNTPGEYTVTLRVFDASGNVGNARASIRR